MHAKLVTVFLHFYMYIHVTRYEIRSSFVTRGKRNGVTGDFQFLGGMNFLVLAPAPAKLYQQHGGAVLLLHAYIIQTRKQQPICYLRMQMRLKLQLHKNFFLVI